jgi:hypothetical protein
LQHLHSNNPNEINGSMNQLLPPNCKTPPKPTNREALNAKARARRRANPEPDREHCHHYARAHRADVTARVRRWQLKQDPEAFRALQRRYSANWRARKLQAAAPTPAAPTPAAVTTAAL